MHEAPSADAVAVACPCAPGFGGRERLDLLAAPAAAGPIVDPSTLQPEPPPGAVCRADGPWTICQTTFLANVVNEPILFLDLPCGTVYETHLRPSGGHPLVPGREARQALRQSERRGHLEPVADRRRADGEDLAARELARRVRRAGGRIVRTDDVPRQRIHRHGTRRGCDRSHRWDSTFPTARIAAHSGSSRTRRVRRSSATPSPPARNSLRRLHQRAAGRDRRLPAAHAQLRERNTAGEVRLRLDVGSSRHRAKETSCFSRAPHHVKTSPATSSAPAPEVFEF